MKVHVLGGGPGGLYFAILFKKARPDAEVIVFERNRADDTFGWGFNPCTGSLMREQRDSDQRDVSDDESDDDTSAFPGHHREHLWFDSDGERLGSSVSNPIHRDPTGVEIHIEYRPEAGLVTFRVGDGPPVTLSGFGAPLRLKPWAFLMYEADGVAFEHPYIEYSNDIHI